MKDYNNAFKNSYELMAKQFDPKKWVKRNQYDLKTTYIMCDFILRKVYSDSSFAVPQTLVEHC